jgi:phosphate transport system substrate-binding protein
MNRIATGIVALVFLCLGSWIWWGSSSHAQTRRLILTGSSTIAPLVTEIGKRFESLHPGVRIDVQTGGSSRGIADTRRGVADIGMASRSLKKSEKDLLCHPIGRDGICIIVNARNPISSLTEEQVIGIFTHKFQNWKDVSGENQSIFVINKAEGRGTLEVFLKYFQLENPSIHADAVVGDNEQGIKMIAGNPGAIGYVSIGTAEYDQKNGVPIKLLPTAGISASTQTLAKGSFPISRPLNLVTKEVPKGLTKAFIEFCQSKDVHDLIKAQYFVPVAR